MNAESTVFRSSRPTVVVAPGGEGVRAAAWVLSWPMRLAATPMGRRLLVAVALAVVAVTCVGYLYGTADQAASTAVKTAARSTAAPGGAGDSRRQLAAAPVRAKPAATPAEAAAAWWAARQRVAVAKVQPLQQRRLNASEVRVLVVAEAGSQLLSQYVTVRKGPSGWAVP
jgi:hypothetical protein